MNGPKIHLSAGPLLRGALFLTGCGAAAIFAAPSVVAAEGEMAMASRGWTSFSIPAQPLAAALSAYGEATHIPMLVDTELTAGRRSNAVMGVFTPFDALQGLLAGTGLVARAIGDRGLTLVPLRTAEPASVTPSAASARFDHYSAVIQIALHEVLCRRLETRPGTFRSLVRLWIGDSGRVTRSEVLTSTGDPRRDTVLASELQALVIDEPPPSDLRQPVTLLLLPSAASAAGYCQLTEVEPRRPSPGVPGDADD